MSIKTTLNTKNVVVAKEVLENNPGNTLRTVKTIFNEIIKQNMKWYPYQMQTGLKLSDINFDRRLWFCRCFIN